MKIYTRTGDAGDSSLLSGRRIGKNDLRLKAYGDIDELNALLGVVVADLNGQKTPDPETKKILESIQNSLFNVGSQLACDDEKLRPKLPTISDKEVTDLEHEIDRMEVVLPPLKNFILPGGSSLAARVHVARTVARRAERQMVELHAIVAQEVILIRYINRLSDFLFVLARYLNHQVGGTERLWTK
jgi:cob(I)alamin adenosyltransferase